MGRTLIRLAIALAVLCTIAFLMMLATVPPKHVVRVAKRCSGRGALVLAVAYFVMVWIGKSERREVLRTHIVETAKRIYGAPELFYYAHPC